MIKKLSPKVVQFFKLLADIDWKALAITLGILGGMGGAIWNTVDSYLEKIMSNRTQKNVYEVLVVRLDELSARIEVLEKLNTVEVKALPKRAMPPRGTMVMLKDDSADTKMPPFEVLQKAQVNISKAAMLDDVPKQ